MKKSLISAGALAVAISQASFAQTLTPDQLAQRNIERRAVEVVNWGMSAVNYDLMLQEMLTKTAGKVNQVVYWSRPLDWHNQTLTPNPDAIYLMAFFNTKDAGPVVVDIPAAGDDGTLNGNIVDIWQMPLEDAGPSGADAGKGGKYLILPPGYASPVPEGYIALRPATFGSFALLRSLNVKDVPVDGFWSISLYNAEGYYQKNPYDAYSLNNITSKKNADGSVTIQFGGCDGKISNCVPIMNGWSYTVRLYRARPEILNGEWKFSESQPAS